MADRKKKPVGKAAVSVIVISDSSLDILQEAVVEVRPQKRKVSSSQEELRKRKHRRKKASADSEYDAFL